MERGNNIACLVPVIGTAYNSTKTSLAGVWRVGKEDLEDFIC